MLFGNSNDTRSMSNIVLNVYWTLATVRGDLKMAGINFKQIEYHQVHVYKDMVVEEESIIKWGLTVERFNELLVNHSGDLTSEQSGDVPTEEESSIFQEIVWEAECLNSEQDWFSDRKGGYEISYGRAADGS